jgi:VWFA-related protein
MTSTTASRAVALLASVCLGLAVSASAQQGAQTPAPTFHTSTDRIVIDVTVVPDKGDLPDLSATDFSLMIDGKPRPIVSAEFVRTAGATAAGTGEAGPGGETFSSNARAAGGGRLVVLAFDLEGIAPGGGRDAAQAASAFLDTLSPADQVSLLSLPNGTNVDFTTDRTPVREALRHVSGRGIGGLPLNHAIGISEAFEIDRGNTFALDRVVGRECSGSAGVILQGETQSACPRIIRDEARMLSDEYRLRSQKAFQMFQALLVALQRVDAPKVVIWISGGVPLPFQQLANSTLSADAAAAHAVVYVVHLDNVASLMEAARGQRSPTRTEDRAISIHGLDIMAGATRGAVFSSQGTGSDAFERISREMSSYYLLSTDAEPSDRDGKPHKIKVSVATPGVTVRARREFVAKVSTSTESEGGSTEEQVANVLRSPVPATGLPLAVATYNLLAPGGDKVRVLVASDLGRQESGPLDATLGYAVRSSTGKVVASAVHTARAEPLAGEASGPAHTTVAIDLPPGAYTMKLAVVDSRGRRGSVERAFEASVKGSGGLEVADLVLAPPISESAPAMRLTAAPSANGAPLDAYLELYGAVGAAKPRVTIAVSDQDAGAPLATADAEVSQRGDKGRYVAEAALPLGLLPPGAYVARATVTVGATTVERTRQFTVLAPVPADDLFKAALAARIGEFTRDSVLTPGLLKPALESARSLDGGKAGEPAVALATAVAGGDLRALTHPSLGSDESLLASFLRGLGLYREGKIEDAAGQFRAAIRRSPDFLSGVFYLGSCYAAGGKGREAVAAWQTALINDDAPPEVYRLVADGYLRIGDPGEASTLLEEAVGRWPDDEAFRVQGAIARAANGHVDEALEGLMSSLERPSVTPEVSTLAVQLAVAQVAAHDDEASESALRALLDRLTSAGVPTPPVAGRWLAYLDQRTSH